MRRSTGKDASKDFVSHFSSALGAKRWPGLASALAEDVQHVALLNQFAQCEAASVPGAVGAPMQLSPVGSTAPGLQASQLAHTAKLEPPGCDPCTNLKTHYYLDPASLLPPLLLGVRPGHTVLDMCAAPGGKSLALAQLLFPAEHASARASTTSSHPQQPELPADTGSDAGSEAAGSSSTAEVPQGAGLAPQQQGIEPHPGGLPLQPPARSVLVSNEPDKERRHRLARVLQEYLPLSLLTHPSIQHHGVMPGAEAGHIGGSGPGGVRLAGYHAEKHWMRHELEVYDRVLLDVPCSSDRHVLKQAVELQRGKILASQWSLSKVKTLAALQLQLVLAGLRALKPGGRLVYSTCSMSPLENDGVVAAALARCPQGAVTLVAPPAGKAAPSDSSSAAEAYALASFFGGERTQHGWLCLPDTSCSAGHCGPMYVSILEKQSSFSAVNGLYGIALRQLSLQDDSASSSDEGERDGAEQES